MSEREEEVPELDADTKAFLARHQQTGEPSPEALERVRSKLETKPAAPAPVGKPATVTRLPQRRPMFPPEVKAAAAVVLLLLGAQLIYLAIRARAEAPLKDESKPAEVKVAEDAPKPSDAQLEAVAQAWRAGDFDGARRLAAKECNSAACSAISGELAEMLDLAKRVDQLTDDERGRLSAFDQKLSNSRDSALRRRLERPAPPSPEALATAQKLYEEANAEKKAKNFERAVVRLEKCVKVAPGYHPCYRLMGSVYAAIAMRDQSAHDMEKAKQAYLRFLEVAPADDEYVPKVRTILDAAGVPLPPSPWTEEPEESENAVATGEARLVKDGDLVRLGLGMQAVLKLERPISRIAVGDASTAEVKTLGGSQLLVIGYSEGKTSLIAWDTNNERTSLLLEVIGSTASPTESEEISLVADGHTTVTLGADIARVAVGDPGVADIKVTGSRELQIEGVNGGKTTVLVWFSSGGRKTITVDVKASRNSEDRVQSLLMQASLAQARGDYAEMRKATRELSKLDPGNPGLTQMKNDLQRQAREKYLLGYQLKDENPTEAIRLFKEVVKMTEPEDELKLKALGQFSALEKAAREKR